MGRKKQEETVYQTKDFLSLRWQWYQKLRESGFHDLEYHCVETGETLPTLDGMSGMDLKKSDARWGRSKVEYYRLAEQQKRLVKQRRNKPAWHYKAWCMHADGVGMKAIATKLGMSASEVIRYIKKESSHILKAQQSDE